MQAERSGTADLLAWLGVAGMLAVALVRSTSMQAAWRWFDVDPIRSPGALEAVGASGGLLLDAALLLSASLLLASRPLRGRRLDGVSLLLVVLPVPILAWHARGDLEQAWRGASLAAGWIALVAAAHLRDDPRLRVLFAAGLLAAAVPWLARAGEQWLVEIPASIAHFEANRGEVLASFGWSERSEAALLYERRLAQAEAGAWFGLANVFSALLAACAVAWTQLTLATRGRALGGGTVLLAGVVALAAVVGVAINGSKGAIAALLAGLAVAAIGGTSGRTTRDAPPRGWRSAAGRVALLGIPLGIAAVVLRGLLPEGFLGERSMVFRWHYLVGSAWTLLAEPLRGVGPAGFQEWYLLVKPIRSPEAVQSAHSLVADSLLAVGVLGLAWFAALARVLWRRDEPSGSTGSVAPSRGGVLLLGVALAAATAVLWAIEPSSRGGSGMARWIGILLFLPTAIVARSILAAVDPARLAWILGSVAFVLLLQGQIEMTFFAPGSIAWAMLAVGLAGSPPAPRRGEPTRRPRVGVVIACVPAAIALLVLAGPFRAAAQAESRLALAAEPLDEVGRAIEERRAPALDPLAARRRAAARLSALADEGGPAAARAGSLALEQLLAVAAETGTREDLAAARTRAEANLAFGRSARRLAERARVLLVWRAIEPGAVDPRGLAEAIAQALVLQPQDVGLWIDLGDARRDAGDLDDARAAWRTALEVDAALALDPLVRLPETRRRELEVRLAE